MNSELILLFHRNKNDYPKAFDQLAHDLDEVLKAAVPRSISLIVCTKPVWIELESELYPLLSTRDNVSKIQGYNKVGINKDEDIFPTAEIGFNSLTFRGLPIVAMDVDMNTIVGARLSNGD